MELDLELHNGFGVAATLRGLAVSVAEEVGISRRKTLFGTEVWQPVDLIRLEPGEVLALARPDYSVVAFDVDAPLDAPVAFEVTADFGPLGAFTVYTVAQNAPADGEAESEAPSPDAPAEAAD